MNRAIAAFEYFVFAFAIGLCIWALSKIVNEPPRATIVHEPAGAVHCVCP